MAVLKSLLVRGGRKQIGGIVLYTRNGETIARELAPQVNNPRSPAQMEQRVRLANLVSFYRANMRWMRGSFESKKDSESDYNAFVSANIGTTEVALTKSDVNSGAAVVAPYKITSGSLQPIETTLNGTDLTSNINVGALTINEDTTIGDLSAAIIENNAGIVEGMQLSIIINLQLASAGTGIPYITTRAYELIIQQDNTTLLSTAVPDEILEVAGGTNPVLGIDTSELGDGAAAFVISQTIGGKTKVSTQSLVFFGSNATYRNYTSSQQWALAVQSYGEGADDFLNSNSAATASSVAPTLALLGVTVANREYVNGGRLQALLAANDSVSFSFNRRIANDAVVSAYYQIGTQATKYNLTSVVLDSNRRSINGTIGSTTLPTNGAAFTLVAVVDGDEFPIRLNNFNPAGGGDSGE